MTHRHPVEGDDDERTIAQWFAEYQVFSGEDLLAMAYSEVLRKKRAEREQNRREEQRFCRVHTSNVVCVGCGFPIEVIVGEQGRQRRYHSRACQMRAYRKRKAKTHIS